MLSYLVLIHSTAHLPDRSAARAFMAHSGEQPGYHFAEQDADQQGRQHDKLALQVQ
ncbi:hypothetical protein D3C80_2203710 [compost metagenome]